MKPRYIIVFLVTSFLLLTNDLSAQSSGPEPPPAEEEGGPEPPPAWEDEGPEPPPAAPIDFALPVLAFLGVGLAYKVCKAK